MFGISSFFKKMNLGKTCEEAAREGNLELLIHLHAPNGKVNNGCSFSSPQTE
jgi:hypothetical protein